jgi:hypothetical protein
MLRHLSKLIGRANKKMMEVRLWNFFRCFVAATINCAGQCRLRLEHPNISINQN